MYTDFVVWHNNYSILATNVNPLMVPSSGAVTAEDIWLLLQPLLLKTLLRPLLALLPKPHALPKL